MLEIKVSLPAKKENIEYLDELIINTLNSFHIEEAKKIQFALHEVIINSIQACKKCNDECNEMLTVELDILDGIVKAKVKDYFGGFEVKDFINHNITAEDLLKENGRGMLLIHHFVDELNFYSDEDGAFIVCLSINIEIEKKNNTCYL